MKEDGKEAYTYAYNQWLAGMAELHDAEVLEIKSITPVFLGTGNASVHEAGLLLMKPWGVPYISGTTLKGAVSGYLARNGGKDWTRSPKKSDYQLQLFGGPKGKVSYVGNIVFGDAWITPECVRKGHWYIDDIITTHHKEYYGGKRFPDGIYSYW